MAEIELGLALYGLYGHSLRLLIDLASRSAGSLKISVRHPVGRVRIELRALIRPAKVKADACLFYWREHTAYMFIRVHTYAKSYVCLFACECVWDCVYTLA